MSWFNVLGLCCLYFVNENSVVQHIGTVFSAPIREEGRDLMDQTSHRCGEMMT